METRVAVPFLHHQWTVPFYHSNGIKSCLLLEIIYGVTFYIPHDWLKNNQSGAASSTSTVPPHVHTFFKLTDLPFFPFDINDVTQNLDC